jgi:F0F1-type ATP synthase assembly protein I
MKKHLLISIIISVFCYLVVSIQQQHLDISQYTNDGALFLSFLMFASNVSYYINKYLDGEFTNEKC